MPEDDSPLNVAYLGPEASFSHQAAIEVFAPRPSPSSSSSAAATSNAGNPSITLHPLPSFSAIFSAIQKNASSTSALDLKTETKSEKETETEQQQQQRSYDYDYAVAPFENSTNGSVVQVLDLLAQCGLECDPDSDSGAAAALYPDVEVCAEYYLPVHHCLFVAQPGSKKEEGEHTTTSSSDSTAITTPAGASPSDPKTTATALASIRTLYTHPQVWGQCGRFLTAQFPLNVVERIDVGSTSAAAQLVAGDANNNNKTTSSNGATTTTSGSPISAAIASKLAGQKHNLVCLAENIEDEPGSNTTRFFVLRNRKRRLLSRRSTIEDEDKHKPERQQPRYYKSLITFTIDHTRPGSLADALAVFKQYSFNLTSIDTRPSRKRNWQYVFLVECEETLPINPSAGRDDQEQKLKLANLLQDLRKFTGSLRYLGRFEDQLRSRVRAAPVGT